MKLVPRVSYAILGSSEFLVNRVMDYLKCINIDDGVSTERNIFEAYMVESDTQVPNKSRIVLSRCKRDDLFVTIDIDSDVVGICLILAGLENCDDELKKFLKNNLRKYVQNGDSELVFYYVSAVAGLEDPSVSEAMYILSKYEYKANHSTVECYKTLIDFVSNPCETALSKLLLVFNEEDYQKMINCTSTLVNDTPEWIKKKFGGEIESAIFTKSLLNLSLVILESKSREDFILRVLKKMIYR